MSTSCRVHLLFSEGIAVRPFLLGPTLESRFPSVRASGLKGCRGGGGGGGGGVLALNLKNHNFTWEAGVGNGGSKGQKDCVLGTRQGRSEGVVGKKEGRREDRNNQKVGRGGGERGRVRRSEESEGQKAGVWGKRAGQKIRRIRMSEGGAEKEGGSEDQKIRRSERDVVTHI